MSIMNSLKEWWAFDEDAEKASADNPLTPLSDAQKRETFPLLTLAFGWGFLVTGLMMGGLLGAGMPFDQLVQASFLGNSVNFIIGALAGYMGFKTACNSGILFRLTYGRIGAAIPVILLGLMLIGWQGIVVGAFGTIWSQSAFVVDMLGIEASVSTLEMLFYAIAIIAGLLFTWTTYKGVEGLEKVATPSVLVLIGVGLYAGWSNIHDAGGWAAFKAMSADVTKDAGMTLSEGVNLVIGSWIAGAIVMAEYTRFSKKGWVAIAIPFIVLMVSQWFLQILGAFGGIVSGSFDFTSYLLGQGMVIGGIGIIAMSLALWTTGDANLYLPVIQTSSVFRRPQKVMTVICGVLGTILGLGLYQQFMGFINLLAVLTPPLIGAVFVDFYIVHKMSYDGNDVDHMPTVNWIALLAYATGAGLAYAHGFGAEEGASALVVSIHGLTSASPDWLIPALLGLLGSMASYLILYFVASAAGMKVGYANRTNA